MKIYPNKLTAGDEVRVIAPSRSLKIISQSNIDYVEICGLLFASLISTR